MNTPLTFDSAIKILLPDYNTKRVRYNELVEQLRLPAPVSEKTGKTLAVGGDAYKAAIRAEIIQRAAAVPVARNELFIRSDIQYENPDEADVGSDPYIVSANTIDSVGTFMKQMVLTKNSKDRADLYSMIKAAIKKTTLMVSYVGIIYHDNEGNKPRVISVRPNIISEGLEAFDAFLEEVETGKYVKAIVGENAIGSDPIDTHQYSLLLNRFFIGFLQTRFDAYGDPKDFIFDVVGIKSLKRTCAYDCLKHLGYTYPGAPEDLCDVKNLSKYIEEAEIPVLLISNGLAQSSAATRKLLDESKDKIDVIQKGVKRKVRAFRACNSLADNPNSSSNEFTFPEAINVIKQGVIYVRDKNGGFIYDEIGSKVIEKSFKTHEYSVLIYDRKGEHIDVAKNKFSKDIIKPDVWITENCDIVRDGKQIMRLTTLITNVQFGKKLKEYYVFFDYETVVDYSRENCVKEYSISALLIENYEKEESYPPPSRENCKNYCDVTPSKNKSDEKNAKLDAKISPKEEVEEMTPSPLTELCYAEADGAEVLDTFIKMNINIQTFMGYDCSEQFLAWIHKIQKDKKITFVGFNNTNFDNFILLRALLLDKKYDFDVKNVFYNGSQLLNFTLNGRHKTFDIRKHLVGSLAANCNSFKIKAGAKKSFDHRTAQVLHDDGKLIEYITDNSELKEYNEFDVISTAILYKKYQQALMSIESARDLARELYNVPTIGSFVYKIFGKHVKDIGIELPTLEKKQYEDLQKFKVAGRVEMFNGVQNVGERLASTDVCSLYPYVMGVHDCYYPCGEVMKTEKYMGDNIIGFYYCDIDQSNLAGMDLPLIYPEKTKLENKWDHQLILKDYLISNVMIKLLLDHGCKVDIKNGFYFTERSRSCDMFTFLLRMMGAKNEQDTFKSSKKAEEIAMYNPALRETLKLLMNSLSGKVIEGLHTEKTSDVGAGGEELLKILAKAESVNVINQIGNRLFVSYTVSVDSVLEQQRPIYLGCLIYDYAKQYMYRNSYAKIGKSNLLYTDTDASKFRYRHFLKWKDWIDRENVQVPHWKDVEEIDERYKNHKMYDPDSKVFGSFEDELEEMVSDEYKFICLEKKSWLYAIRKTGSDWKAKFKFKGLNNSAQILTLKEDVLRTKVAAGVERYRLINENDGLGSVREVYKRIHDFYDANKINCLGNGRAVDFFEQIIRDGSAHVLTHSFRRIVRNSAHDVEVGDTERYNPLLNSVQINIAIKKITLVKDR